MGDAWRNTKTKANIAEETSITLRTGAFPKQKLRDKQRQIKNKQKKKKSGKPALWSVVFNFLEVFLNQKSYVGFLYAPPTDFNTADTTKQALVT